MKPSLGALKEIAHDRLPLLPVSEQSEATLRRRTLARLQRWEDAEVARLRAQLHTPPSAHVVTVIATYRRAGLVRRAVDSALAQPVDDHVVVVVDDGGGQLPAFDDPRVCAVRLSANSGICGLVRNVGVRISDSAVVAFLDDDNVWHRDHLPAALAALDDGAEVAYSGVQLVDVDDTVVGEVCTPFDLSALRHRNYVDASTIVARRSPAMLFSRLPRRRGGARQEDWELAYRMAKRRPLAFTGGVSVTYLLNPESRYTTH